MFGSNGSLQNLLARLRAVTSEARDDRGDAPPQRGAIIALCLLVSVVLWFTSTLREDYLDTLQLPTRVLEIPADQNLALAQRPPESIRIQVQAEGFQLMQLHLNPPVIPLDPTVQRLDLRAVVDQELTQNVRLASVTPPIAEMSLETRVERQVPIELRTDITLADAYEFIQQPYVQPDSVLVSGAASIVEQLSSWPLRRVRIENLSDSLRQMVPLSDTLDGLVQVSRQQVELRAASTIFTSDRREIEVVVEGAPSATPPVKLDPLVVTVSYSIRLDEYDLARQAPDFYAVVDYEDILNDDAGYVEPRLNLPEGLDIRDPLMQPSRLSYVNVLFED